jgi:heme exporter protein D
MNWDGLAGFLEMGGYALYVWGSFGVTTVLITMEILFLHNRRRAAIAHRGGDRR